MKLDFWLFLIYKYASFVFFFLYTSADTPYKNDLQNCTEQSSSRTTVITDATKDIQSALTASPQESTTKW